MKIIIVIKAYAVYVSGHYAHKPACGAITMLLRAASILAKRAIFKDGTSIVILKCRPDFLGLVYGLECIAREQGTEIEYAKAMDYTELLKLEAT